MHAPEEVQRRFNRLIARRNELAAQIPCQVKRMIFKSTYRLSELIELQKKLEKQ
jgi:hypothetical protein